MGSTGNRSANVGRCKSLMMAWRVLLCSAGIALTVPAMAVADSARFNIPAQPLPIALKAFATQAHMQLLYQYDAVEGAKGNPVSGDLDKHRALTQLLRNTGLEAIYSSDSAATIRRVRADTSSQPTRQSQQNQPTLLVQEQAPATAQSNSSAPQEQDTAAQKQGPAAAPGQPNPSEAQEVTVTATRVNRSGYNAPTPTTVVSSEFLEDRAASTVVDTLATLPAFKDVATPGTAGFGVGGTAGESFVNLRGLGANDTLVLVDGERVVPNTNTGLVDVSMIPSALISRVDVVTGGASADWGSDAVAGVVNFILDTNYTGLKGQLEGGVSSRGDDKNGKASLTYGTGFDHGRGHFLISAEYYNSDGLSRLSRPWSEYPVAVVTNPAYKPGNGQYEQSVQPFAYFSYNTFGGVITSGPLKGIQFGPGGTPEPYTTGSYLSGTSMVMPGPSPLPFTGNTALLEVPQTRESIFSRTSYEFSDFVTGYLELSYGISNTGPFSSSAVNTSQKGVLTINADNAYLSPIVRSAMAADDISSFTLGMFRQDWGPSEVTNDNTSQRYEIGAEGAFGKNWTYKAYYQHGESTADFAIDHNALWNNVILGSDAVVGPSGSIVCRSTLTNPGNGCQPLNVFGVGSASSAALQYVFANSFSDLTYKRDAVAASATGNPFSIWAGPVSIATGAEYRNDSVDQAVDPLSQADLFFIGNPQALSGSESVAEGFVETVVPLLKDVPLAQSLDFNGAGRYTSYSLSGNVFTWKVGLTDDLTKDVRIRLVQSHDIRAPDLLELYSTRNQSTASVIDPFRDNASGFIEAASSGNPNLKPEVSNTTSAGIVLHPTWLPRFNMSLDYYNIQISDAISTVSYQDIVDGCYSGTAALCALIQRDSTGVIRFITAPYLNISQVKTSGMDFETSYNFQLSDLLPFASGTVDMRLLGSYMWDFISNDGVGDVIETAGSLTDGLPKLSGDFGIGYTKGPVHLLLDTVYIGGGQENSRYTGYEFYNNNVQSIVYLNGTMEYSISGNSMVYFHVNNILDQPPPPIFSTSGGANYDRVGRAFKLGIRFNLD
jgi:iron complex outermembrane recepter protein